MRLYQTASRAWLTGAAASLLLPTSLRLGWWVPLHLALAGAVSLAISGAMQTFVAALTATASAPSWMTWSQFGLVSLGAGLVVAGRMAGVPQLVAVGGSAFLAGALLLGWIVLRARWQALHLRHRLPVALYLAAVAFLLGGGTVGTLLGAGVVPAERWLGLRGAHLVLNVLGWASVTIAATLVTLLPTILRVRMPRWPGRLTGWLLVTGVGLAALGLAWGVTPVAAVGSLVYLAGVAGLLEMIRRVLSAPRRWPVPIAGRHLLLALVWFVGGVGWMAAGLSHGAAGWPGGRACSS
jgi:nitrite reductase (NO-forming)